jgi:predicted DNA-binding protein (UPF0278 family)
LAMLISKRRPESTSIGVFSNIFHNLIREIREEW